MNIMVFEGFILPSKIYSAQCILRLLCKNPSPRVCLESEYHLSLFSTEHMADEHYVIFKINGTEMIFSYSK